jgi:peptide/nickel transport system substrate-binding protein
LCATLWLVFVPGAARAQSDAQTQGQDAARDGEPGAALPASARTVAQTQAERAQRRVYAGVYLHDLIRFDQKAGTFDAEFELWVKWNGDFDPDRVRVANAADVDRVAVARESEGSWHAARYRVRGTMRGEFPVHRFPFDAQSPAIELELDARDGLLVPDLTASGMREHFSISGWSYEPRFQSGRATLRLPSDLGALAGEGDPTITQRAVFRVTLRRPLITAALKFFLPLLIILLVALVALFLPSDLIEARASIGVTALLACFAFQFAVSDSMPDVSYMTLADSIFLLSYACTSLALVATVVSYALERKERRIASARSDLVARLLIPLILVPAALKVLRESPEPPRRAIAPLPAQPRTASARPLLRVGATQLATANAGITFRAVYWSPTQSERGEPPQAWAVENIPELDEDALRINTDGSLDARWRLRANARWSDGSPVTARDVVFAQRASPSQDIASIETITEREFIVHYRGRTASALESFALQPEPSLGSVFARAGDGGADAIRSARRAGRVPGLGPYRVASFEAERSLVLEANPHFLGAPPAIARIEVRRYESAAALVAAYERGEVDLTIPNAVTPEAATELAVRRPESVFVRASRLMTFLHPDLNVPALQSLEVRRAIAEALDRDMLAREGYGDTGRAAHAPWVGALPSGASAIAYDPTRARERLAHAGASGARLSLFHSTDPVDRRNASRIAEMLRAIGLQIDTVEARDIADRYRTRRHGGLLLYTADVDTTDHPLRWWNLPMQGSRYDRAARNAALDDAVAALADRFSRTIYRERRESLRERLAALVNERLPIIPVVFANQRVVATPSLRGWDLGEATDFGEQIERWYFAR